MMKMLKEDGDDDVGGGDDCAAVRDDVGTSV